MNESNILRVAIPYYGLLIRPGGGFERIYFVADLGEDDSARKSRMSIWNPNQFGDLSAWLQAEQVGKIVCSQCPPALRRELESAGIEVLSRHQDGLDKKLESCLAELVA